MFLLSKRYASVMQRSKENELFLRFSDSLLARFASFESMISLNTGVNLAMILSWLVFLKLKSVN